MQSTKSPMSSPGQPAVPSLDAQRREHHTVSGEVPAHATAHALQAAEENERALQQRLHRVHDPKGMQLLRGLREHIAELKARLQQEELR